MKKYHLIRFAFAGLLAPVLLASCDNDDPQPQPAPVKQYTVTFVTGGGLNNLPPVQVDSAGRVVKPAPSPLAADSIFIEWRQPSQMVDGGDDFDFKNTKITSDLTLYGIWVYKVKMEMIAVTGGTFTMGSATVANDGPQHQVTVTGFKIGKYEVKQNEYKAIMGSLPTNNLWADDFKPVSGVSWQKCLEFCNRLSIIDGKTPCYTIKGYTDPARWGTPDADWDNAICNMDADGYRLPTEAEWEYAAGGGASNRTLYAGTDDPAKLGEYAWIPSNSGGVKNETGPQEVGTKKANGLGIYDMIGNVAEWTFDVYVKPYPSTPQTDPVIIPTSSLTRAKCVDRGSSFYWGDQYCIVTFRDNSGPAYNAKDMGLRVVCK